eukprot:501922_1
MFVRFHESHSHCVVIVQEWKLVIWILCRISARNCFVEAISIRTHHLLIDERAEVMLAGVHRTTLLKDNNYQSKTKNIRRPMHALKQLKGLLKYNAYLNISRARIHHSSFKQYKCHNLSIICKRNLFVQIDPTPNVLSQKFIPSGHKILPEDDRNHTLDISSYKEAMNKSGLARDLFVIEGVKNVFMTSDYLTVTVDDTLKWPDIQGQVVGIINDYLLSNKPVLEDTYNKAETEDYDDDDEVIAIIRELIDTRIRPNVQYDGGDVIFKGFDHESGKLSVKLVGACKGCESAQETLQNGIERMIRFYVPEVSYVEEFLDEEDEKLQQINERALDKVEQKLSQDKQRPSE